MHVNAHSLAKFINETLSWCSFFEPTTVLLHERLCADKLELTRNCLSYFPLKEKIRKLIFMKAHNSLTCRKKLIKKIASFMIEKPLYLNWKVVASFRKLYHPFSDIKIRFLDTFSSDLTMAPVDSIQVNVGYHRKIHVNHIMNCMCVWPFLLHSFRCLAQKSSQFKSIQELHANLQDEHSALQRHSELHRQKVVLF